MKIRCEVMDNGEIQVIGFCLKTDSWLDYLAFKQDAREAFARNDVKAYARSLRAGLLCLFAHMEAVVNEVYATSKVPPIKSWGFCIRANDITKEAKKIVKVPPIAFNEEKNLRDMIAHPGVLKKFDVSESSEGVEKDDSATYERLDYQSLERFESQVSPWVDAICAAFGITRLEDMEEVLEELTSLAGGEQRQKMPEGGPT